MLQGLQALITAIEIVGSFLWVGLIYPEKDRGLVRRIGSAVGVVLATALTIFQRNIAMYSRYYLIFCIILCTLICFLRFGRKRRYLVMMAFYYETIYCLDLLTGIFVGYFVNNLDFVSEQQDILKIDRIIIYLFARCVVTAMLFLMFSLKDKFVFLLFEKYLFIIPIFEHIILFGCDIILEPGKEELAWSHAKIFFVVSVLFIFLLIAFCIYNMKMSISQLLEMQKKLYAQSYENITLRGLEKERLFHDMKNHLLTIHRMAKDGQTERLESYVNRLYESFGSDREYTGNRLVDYLISEKSDRARSRGATVSVDCGGLPRGEDAQKDMDWTALLGNLWDNAIEGCERYAGEREIRFHMHLTGNIIVIHMENSCPAAVRRTGLATWKNPDEMHGFGMWSIRYVISKYNGSFEWDYREEKFVIDITMYL